MSDRIIWGAVNADGTIKAGSGFDSKRIAPGTYIVDWDATFPSMPSVVLTQNYRGWDDFGYEGGKTTDNAVLIASDKNAIKVGTGDGGGNRTDRNFTFIAIGPA